MTDKQKNTISNLINGLQTHRGIDAKDAPIDETAVATKGKFGGQTVARVGLSAVDARFPDVIVSQRGGLDIEAVASYPESRDGHCRYDASLPATALSAAIYGDLHLAKSDYGRKPKAVAVTASA